MPSSSPSFPRRRVDHYHTVGERGPGGQYVHLPVSGLYLSNLSVRLPRNPSTMDVYMMSHVFPPVAGSRSGLMSLASVKYTCPVLGPTNDVRRR